MIASDWMKRNARPLEVARWEYFFEGASRDKVIQYLSAFQNKDGGFGHGLEPDFWSPASSPMATWAAGQILIEIGADSNDKIVKAMIQYLTQTNDKKTGLWPSVLPENNDYPHAPHWHWQEGVQSFWMFNPSVELAAFLVHWSAEQSESALVGWNSIEKAVKRLMSADEMNMHEINNYQQFIKIIQPNEEQFNSIINQSFQVVSDKIISLAELCVDRDISNWSSGYKALPLDFITSPEDSLSSIFGDLIEQNLEYYKEQLSDDGVWDISWSWNDYPAEFAIARRYWQGILAVKRYKLLQSLGYLKGE